MPSPSSAARAVAHHVLLRVAGCVLLSAGCSSGPDGLAPTPAGAGPLVLIDWDARPLPEIPFPNDLATRYDPDSPTGLRLNMSLQGPTALEREVRAKVDTLTGFGIYSPLSVRFTAPLDLDEVLRRHARDLDPADDALFVIDVTEGSPTYLQPVELDIGHGRFPADVADPARYFPNDSRAAEPSILFDTVDEDADGDGVLDWGEDTDNDGLLDIPNVWPVGGDPRDDLLSWYDRQTDTLVFRPVVPMREETTYAVLLTSRLSGVRGEPPSLRLPSAPPPAASSAPVRAEPAPAPPPVECASASGQHP